MQVYLWQKCRKSIYNRHTSKVLQHLKRLSSLSISRKGSAISLQPMSDRVPHYSERGQTLSPIRPSQKFSDFVRAFGVPIYQNDLASFCSTCKPMKSIHIPKAFAISLQPMSDRVSLYFERGQTLPPIRPSQKFPKFRACLWCPHTSKRPCEFLLYL